MSEKIKIGQIGFGRFGFETLFKIFQSGELTDVVAVTDIDPAARLKAENHNVPAFNNPQDMFLTHPEINYVAVAVPHHQQLPVLATVADHCTKHQLSVCAAAEKPLASSLKNAVETVQILREAFIHALAFTRFSYDPYQSGIATIAQDAIGAISNISDIISITGPKDVFEPYIHSPNPADPEISWGNGILNGYHGGSVLALLAGLPTAVTAEIDKRGLGNISDVDDTAIVQAKYPDLEAEYRCIWGITPEIISDVHTAVTGNKGKITIEQWGDNRIKFTDGEETLQPFHQKTGFIEKHDAGVRNHHLAMINHLLYGETCPLPHHIARSLEIGLIAHTIIEMSYPSSARGGEWVTPGEVIEDIMSLDELQAKAVLAQLPQLRSA